MTKFTGARLLITEFNHSRAITFGAITFTDITMAINGTINTVIIIAISSEVIATTRAGFGFFVGHGLAIVLIFLVKVVDSYGD
jgi:hypothetical protein